MKRDDKNGTAPPPLEEVDIDELDGANGGFFDLLGMFGGFGMGGGGFPMGGGGGWGGFPGGGQMPQMPMMMPQNNSANIIKSLSALMDLSDRRRGNSRGRR